MENLRYPIGKHERPATVSPEQRALLIRQIEELPAALRDAVKGLSAAQLDTPYRPDGWSLRQVANHLVDSHVNAFVRFKLALTEDRPAIKPYEQSKWAECADTRTADPEQSVRLLEALHARWVVLLRSMTDADFRRVFVHPESGEQRLDQTLSLYAWHGRHHTAHITSLRQRKGWL